MADSVDNGKNRRVRRPGQARRLTVEQLMSMPISELSARERVVRRRLARREEGMAYSKMPPKAKCTAITKSGEPCKAYVITGHMTCLLHADDQTKIDHGLLKPGKVRASELQALIVEVAAEELLKPYLTALGLEFVGFDEETGEPVIRRVNNGAVMYGESKDGDIVKSEFLDLGAQIETVEKLLNRVYGRPRQSMTIEGGAKPIKVEPVRSVERAKGVASLLDNLGAIPHDGRRRAKTSKSQNGKVNER